MKSKRCKKGKQFVALLLALIMVSGLTAFAAGSETSSEAPESGRSTAGLTESLNNDGGEPEDQETSRTPSQSGTVGEDEADTGENSGSTEGTDTGSAGDEEKNGDDVSGESGTNFGESDADPDDGRAQTGKEEETADAASGENTSEESKDAGDTGGVSVFRVDKLTGDTVISSNESEGIAQLANIIPDINFRTEVWRSMSVAGQLGDPEDSQYEGLEGDELYKAVLENFTGEVYASGYVKEICYKYSFQYKGNGDSEWTTDASDYSYTTYEDALETMQSEIRYRETAGFEVNQESAVIMSKITVTEERKPDDQLIKDITGVEYLKLAERIDFSYNKITSLIPLDIEAIAERFCGGDLYAARSWFGEEKRNTFFTFVGNPITEFPSCMPGRIYIDPMFNQVPVAFEKEPVVLVKDPSEELPLPMSIDMPVVRIGGQAIQFYAEDLNIPSDFNTLGEQLTAEYKAGNSGGDAGTGESGQIYVSGITHSGEATFSIGSIDSEGTATTMTHWYSVDRVYGSISESSCGITVALQQQVRILYEVLPGEPDGSIEISLNKYELGTTEPVSGAVYRLFKMEMKKNGEDTVYTDGDKVTIGEDGCAVNQDGEIIGRPIEEDGIQPEYTTDEKGGFTCSADLWSGTYCFIETESPEGYEVNTNPVMFTVGEADSVRIDGGTRLTKTELSGMPEEAVYQLYVKEDDSNVWNLYNGDEELSFSADENGTIKIGGLSDGSYQLRPASPQPEESIIEFRIADGGITDVSQGITAEAETVTYIDRYSEPVSVTLPQPAEDQELDSLTIEWYTADNSIEQEIFKVGEDFQVGDTFYENATAEDVVKATQEFINLNKGTATAVGSIQGQVTISPVYKYKPSGSLKTEDPAKVRFSFVKTDGDPSDREYKGLSGAEFTLYHADDHWEWTEDADGVYKTTQADAGGVVGFGDLDSGNYIMKETDVPEGYAALPGYWKITADAWTTDNEEKLNFIYVREDGSETDVSEEEIIPADAYGNKYYIPNYPVDELPSMGGRGTRIFTVFGLLLTGTAIMLFVCARRNKKGKRV